MSFSRSVKDIHVFIEICSNMYLSYKCFLYSYQHAVKKYENDNGILFFLEEELIKFSDKNSEDSDEKTDNEISLENFNLLCKSLVSPIFNICLGFFCSIGFLFETISSFFRLLFYPITLFINLYKGFVENKNLFYVDNEEKLDLDCIRFGICLDELLDEEEEKEQLVKDRLLNGFYSLLVSLLYLVEIPFIPFITCISSFFVCKQQLISQIMKKAIIQKINELSVPNLMILDLYEEKYSIKKIRTTYHNLSQKFHADKQGVKAVQDSKITVESEMRIELQDQQGVINAAYEKLTKLYQFKRLLFFGQQGQQYQINKYCQSTPENPELEIAMID